MATQSSIHACEIPWTEEPGRLQSTGSQWPDIGLESDMAKTLSNKKLYISE